MSSQLHSPVLSGQSRKAIWSHCACLRGKAKQPLKSSSYSSRFAIQNRKILILGMPSFRFRHMLENFQSSGAHTNIGHPRMWQRSKRCRSVRLPLSLKLANITLIIKTQKGLIVSVCWPSQKLAISHCFSNSWHDGHGGHDIKSIAPGIITSGKKFPEGVAFPP